MVMLSSGHTTSTGMLAMFTYTAVAGGDVAAAVCLMLAERAVNSEIEEGDVGNGMLVKQGVCEIDRTYCLRVLVNRVGIVATGGGRS